VLLVGAGLVAEDGGEIAVLVLVFVALVVTVPC
jgi:hypothetical protein